MFAFQDQGFEDKEQDFAACQQLVSAAQQMGVDTDMAFGLSLDMEAEQIAQMRAELKAAVDAEIERRRRAEQEVPVCHIGPYAGGYCTICGLRDPSCSKKRNR